MDHQTSQVTGRPYSEKKEDGYLIREFSQDTPSFEFVWHRDKEDREVKQISGQDWYIQFENSLPVLLEDNKFFQIKKNTWHRIINRSKNDLEILLRKYK